MKRRAALAIARDLRSAERLIEANIITPAGHREAERLISSALARLIAADDMEQNDD